MRKFLWTMLKILLGIIIFVIISVAIFYVTVDLLHSSVWMAGCIIGLFIGIVTVAYFVIHYLKRLRQKKFVEQIVAQDDLMQQKIRNEEYKRLTELKERWLGAVETLRGSSLIKVGNPLYVLPWYMIIGETDSGKSSSIANAGLHSINSKVGPVPGVASTRNCDWWFFNNAIVLDTAGKYVVPVDGQIDEKEWKEFLVQVATYRKKEPINGIVVTLPMEKLLSEDTNVLDSYGVYVSERVNRIVRVLNAQIPIYLLLTKVDLLQGFNGFSELLTKEEAESALGYTAKENESFNLIVQNTILNIQDFIRNLILRLDGGKINPNIDAKVKVLQFVCNLESISEKIKHFIQVSFDNNTYHEHVLLRGVYLSSALQTGENKCLFAPNLVTKTNNISSSHGYFLKNLFKEILPRDRGIYRPLLDFLKWRTLGSNLVLVAFGILTFTFLAYCCIGVISNDRANDIIGEHLENTLNANTFEEKVLLFEDMIKEIEELDKDRFLKLHFDFITRGHNTVKNTALGYFNREFEERLFNRLLTVSYWNSLIHDESTEKYTEAIGDSIYFYSAIFTYYHDANKKSLEKRREELSKRLAKINYKFWGRTERSVDEYVYLITKYLEFNDSPLFNERLELLAYNNANKLFEDNRDTYWLVYWGDSKTKLVRAGAYWPVSSETMGTEYDISGVYTKEGYTLLNDFWRVIPRDNTFINYELKEKINMEAYTSTYLQKWMDLLNNFYTTILGTPISDRSAIIPKMVNPSTNPYFQIYNRAYKELSFLKTISDVDLEYMDLVHRGLKAYELLEKANAASDSIDSVGNVLNKTGFKVKGLLDKVSKVKQAVNMVEVEKLSNLNKDFFTSLKGILNTYNSERVAKNNLAKQLSGNLEVDNSVNLQNITKELESILELKNDRAEDHAFLKPSGFLPYDSTLMFFKRLRNEMVSCDLQKTWINNVYSKVLKGTASKNQLFGENGLVSVFVRDELKDFIMDDVGGYRAVEESGSKALFTSNFLQFLDNQNELHKVYNVKKAKINIATVPFEANDNALVTPNYVLLKVSCNEDEVLLGNYNYPNKTTINWDNNNCKEAAIEIGFDDIALVYKFEGEYGFANFLNMFSDGLGFKFEASDFPEYKTFLNAYNLRWVKVTYNISGADNVRKYFNYERNPLGIPKDITECDNLSNY